MRHALNLGGSLIFTLAWLGLGMAFVTPPQHHAASPGSIGRLRYKNIINNISAARFATAISSSRQAKDAFLRNIGRKRAGEDVLASELDASIARLIAVADKHGLPSPSRTTVGNLQSWRGRWRICYAPHIQALGKFLLTAFPLVDYDFPTEGGHMLSNVRYESVVFGSGWLNADGRIERVDRAVPSGDRSAGRRREEIVKVVFERFWWDRNGEEIPTAFPVSAGAMNDGRSRSGGVVDSLVQAAGDALFFEGLSNFPVRYLDDDLCVFEFKAAGTVVASQRIE